MLQLSSQFLRSKMPTRPEIVETISSAENAANDRIKQIETEYDQLKNDCWLMLTNIRSHLADESKSNTKSKMEISALVETFMKKYFVNSMEIVGSVGALETVSKTTVKIEPDEVRMICMPVMK